MSHWIQRSAMIRSQIRYLLRIYCSILNVISTSGAFTEFLTKQWLYARLINIQHHIEHVKLNAPKTSPYLYRLRKTRASQPHTLLLY